VSGDAGLVGRHDVRSRLRRAAEAALAGDGQVVLLTGEAGIGKTALAAEAAGWAAARGARVVWGSGRPARRALPRQPRPARVLPHAVRSRLGAGRRRRPGPGPDGRPGISDAFRDAELLADAVDAGLGGRRPLQAALAGYQRQRDQASLPMYEFTAQLAAFQPPRVEDQVLFAALAGRQAEIDRFFGVLAGSEPLRDYLAPGNLVRVIGVRGMAGIVLGRLRADRRRARQPSHSTRTAPP
jgi:hypothetical protein